MKNMTPLKTTHLATGKLMTKKKNYDSSQVRTDREYPDQYPFTHLSSSTCNFPYINLNLHVRGFSITLP